MFSVVRYGGAVALIVLIVLVVLGGTVYRSSAEKDIFTLAEQNNIAAAYGFKKAVWKRYAKGLRMLPCTNAPCPDFSTFNNSLKKDTDNFFKSIPLLQYTLYFTNGDPILDGKKITSGPDIAKDVRLAFLAAQYGNTKSAFEEDYSKNSKTYSVVHSFIPVVLNSEQSNNRVEGIIELVTDVTPAINDLNRFHQIGSVVVILVMLIIYILLFFISRHAEGIIAKQHEMTLDLTSAKASAEEENRAKSRFLANVSHELRTPLNAIIGFSEILKDEVMGPLGNDQYKDYILDIHTSGVHLLSLINDILDFSKAEAGKLEVEMKDVDVTKILKSSMRLIAPRARDAKVELIEKIPKEHIVIRTDAKRLKQVVLNLISNSVKFTPENGNITLYAWPNYAEEEMVVEVRDTGIGIAAKDISKVMATFGQVESKLSRKHEGTGLGLPLTKKLVELMGGTFDIRSEEGKGTTVTINLPLLTEEEYKSGRREDIQETGQEATA